MKLPMPRGPLSTALFPLLRRGPQDLPAPVRHLAEAGAQAEPYAEPYADEDIQITMFACYALHYEGFADVSNEWEWHPSLLAMRAVLEARLEASLRRLADYPAGMKARELPKWLLRLGAPSANNALARHLKEQACIGQYREFAIHRSPYNVIEADPHSWALPRVHGPAKYALVEIQADEYGNGLPGRMHSELFQRMMVELGLDPSYGGHIEQIPAVSLAPMNALSMFGLHGLLRGALLGNLAMIEIGSSYVNRCFSDGLVRLGASEAARWFFDEHIAADAVHEQIAAYNLCGSFAEQCPAEADQVLFGADVTARLSQLSNVAMVHSWAQGRSSLRQAAVRQPGEGGAHVQG